MNRSPISANSPIIMEDEDAIRRRKLAAERRVQERHRALMLEQKQKNKTTAEERQRLLQEMKEREAKEMKKKQEELHRHMEWLERDKARKKEILARQHAVTSRTANKPGAGFGSTTPRELSYLNNLPKSQQTYDKKLSPSSQSKLVQQKLSPPPKKPISSMTSSMYVPSSTPRRPTPKPTTQPTRTPKTPNLMTQSVYTPSPRATPKPIPQVLTPKAKLPPVASARTPKKVTTNAPKEVVKNSIEQHVPHIVETVIEEKPSAEDDLLDLSFTPVEEPTEKVVEKKKDEFPVELVTEKEDEAVQVENEKEIVEEAAPIIEVKKTEEPIKEISLADELAMSFTANPIEEQTHDIQESIETTMTQEAPKEEEQNAPIIEEKITMVDNLLIDLETSAPIEAVTTTIEDVFTINAHEPQFDNTVEQNVVIENIQKPEPTQSESEDDFLGMSTNEKPSLNGHSTFVEPLYQKKSYENDLFSLPGTVQESYSPPKYEMSLADELSSSYNEKPESVEESKLVTSCPPSPPVVTKNEEQEEIQRRREHDQKHNDEVKARFAAIKAKIGRTSPPNSNGNGNGLPPAPAQIAPPADNNKPISDSTAALLQRLSKMGVMKSTKAMESVESLLTRHTSDPKIDQAPDDPVSIN